MKELNLNDRVKVKLTPHGAEVYYHQHDDYIKHYKDNHPNGGEFLKPRMPQIDKDGFTEFTLWKLMQLYGEHIGIGFLNVFTDNNIYFEEK